MTCKFLGLRAWGPRCHTPQPREDMAPLRVTWGMRAPGHTHSAVGVSMRGHCVPLPHVCLGRFGWVTRQLPSAVTDTQPCLPQGPPDTGIQPRLVLGGSPQRLMAIRSLTFALPGPQS